MGARIRTKKKKGIRKSESESRKGGRGGWVSGRQDRQTRKGKEKSNTYALMFSNRLLIYFLNLYFCSFSLLAGYLTHFQN
jgi:hypothetical protein